MVLAALAAGKHVFVEKPLCLTLEEMEQIEAAYDGSRLLMVGFNRRFAPLAQKVKAALAGRTTPLVMTYRVNAGFIPADHWVHDPEVGGGRLLGEVCHFVDFCHFMSDSPAETVSVVSISGPTGKYRSDDNLVVTLAFKDGSVATILYTSKGSKSFSRERFEVFSEDAAAVIEDFRRGQVMRGGTKKSWRRWSMDMGYEAELAAFFLEPWSQNQAHSQFVSCIASTRATLKAQEALTRGVRLGIPRDFF
jgi:predicted dehydrogenase